jgi:hypothetical protein
VYLPAVDAIVDHVATGAQSGDVVVIMSNGGFGGIHEKLLEALRKRQPAIVSSPSMGEGLGRGEGRSGTDGREATHGV